MNTLIDHLTAAHPAINFVAGSTFYWSPAEQTVYYGSALGHSTTAWSLLHEVGHALLGHTYYASDFELLKLEAEAWQKAQAIAPAYGLTIDSDHIQDSLDTYRDWLYQRSTCPACGNTSLQLNPLVYECFNCKTQWSVTASRFCRPYRRMTLNQITTPHAKTVAIFQ